MSMRAMKKTLGFQRNLTSVSNSERIFCTMHRLFLLILFALLPLLGTCLKSTEIDFQMIKSNDSTTNNHGHNSTTHLMEDQLATGLELGISFTINKCGTSKLKNVTSAQLPTFFMMTTLEYDYIMGNHSVGYTSPECPNGAPSEIITTSYTEFIKIQKTGESQIARKIIALLSNGYLSVANSSDSSIHYYSTNEYCLQDIIGQGENTRAKLRICLPSKSRPILNKCCQVGTHLHEGKDGFMCIASKDSRWDPAFVDPNTLEHVPIGIVNPVYRSPKLDCEHREFWVEDGCHDEFYPATNGKTAFIGARRYRWEYLEHSPNLHYCYETISKDNGAKQNSFIMCAGEETRSVNHKAGVSRIYMVCMYIGAFFHLITSIFYVLTWTKQNIHGKTLCSCTLALFLMKVFMGTAHLLGILGNTDRKGFCFFNSVAAQYFMIASFTWLLVVNMDLWWTFRSISPGGDFGMKKRFIFYSLGGWVFPLIVTGISLALNSIYTCRTSRVPIPDYGQYICFVAPWAQGFYVYYILSILIAIAFLFAALTLAGLYSFKKGTNNLRPRSNKLAEDKRIVLLFLKLSVVMGLSWIFEVISWTITPTADHPEKHWVWNVWIIFDLYNALSAILIFIIFVCKRNNLKLLKQTHPSFKVLTTAISRFTPNFAVEGSSTSIATVGEGGPKVLHENKPFGAVTYTKDRAEKGQVKGGFE